MSLAAEKIKWTFEFADDGGYYLYARRGKRFTRHKLPVDGDYYDIADYRLQYIKLTMARRLTGKNPK